MYLILLYEILIKYMFIWLSKFNLNNKGNNTLCKEHIDKIFQSSNTFKCQFCNDEHKIPNDGFSPNYDYINALNLDLHLSDNSKEVKKILRKFKENKTELQKLNNNPEEYISKYFSNIMDRIELQREKLKLRVDNMSDELLEKLRTFELNLNSNDNDIEKNYQD